MPTKYSKKKSPSFQYIMPEQLDNHIQKQNSPQPYLIINTKINYRGFTGLNIKVEINLLTLC